MLKNLLTLIVCVFAISAMNAQSIGIIGSATPTGWDADTDMEQDMGNPDMWSITMDFVTGEAKFRQDDAWDVNWGATDFPTGTGEQGGDNIPVPGGNWTVTFNTATGEYTFTSNDASFASIGIIGTATPNGWDSDTDLVQDPNVPTVWTLELELIDGEAKFRADDDWAVSWGATDFPTGVGALGGDNIPVVPGSYNITFNTATGEYNFESIIATYSTIGLIGDATPGGWDEDTDLTQNPNNPALWSGNITLTDGEAKFRAEDDWAVNWGATDFPTGVAELEGPNIPVVAGEYNVNFNSTTGEYSFDPPISIFNSIGVIGTATAFGFDSDIDMVQDPAQPDLWTLELRLVPGELKFRADDDWAVNWGDDGFPTGTGIQDGPNIMIPFEDNYDITFNATTGEYVLSPGVTWGIIGPASPSGNWDEDTDMELSNAVGGEWSAQFDMTDGECKFRKNDDWTVNYGAGDFPAGVGTQDGPNIPALAGSYNVSMNSGTGDYLFDIVENTTSVLNTQSVKVFPNPTSDLLNISVEAAELEGNVTIQIMDTSGKVVRVLQQFVSGTFAINVSDLNNGLYILQMSNDKYTIGKRFSLAK